MGGREGGRPESKGNRKTTRETSNASNKKTTEIGWVWRRREEGKEVGMDDDDDGEERTNERKKDLPTP